MLIVVHDRDFEFLAQSLLNEKTLGCGNIFEIDAAKDRRDALDRLNNVIWVFGVQANREGVDNGEALENEILAFHHGLRTSWADVTETEQAVPSETTAIRVALNGEASLLGAASLIARQTRVTPCV